MRFYRIGDKVVSQEKVFDLVSEILEAREAGATQEEAARSHDVQRTFVSFLESLGEVRRGKRVAVVGFPIANVAEVQEVADKHGVEYCFLLSQEQREGLESAPAEGMFNLVLETLAKLREFDVVLLLASDRRVPAAERILGNEVIPISLGPSPLRQDVAVDVVELDGLLERIVVPSANGRAADEGNAGRWQRSRK